MNPPRLLFLLATVAVRLSAVLYGSGTDAGWVRLYDAAATAAISSAAKAHKHTANTHATPRDSPLTAGLLPSHTAEQSAQAAGTFDSWLRWRKEREAHDPGFFLNRTCSGCVFPPSAPNRAWREGRDSALDSRTPGPPPAAAHQDLLLQDRGGRGAGGGCLGLFCRARSTQTRRCHGAHISLVLRTQRQRTADPLRPKLPSRSE